MKSEGNTHVCLIIDTICELRRVYYFCCHCHRHHRRCCYCDADGFIIFLFFSPFFLFVRFLLIFARIFFCYFAFSHVVCVCVSFLLLLSSSLFFCIAAFGERVNTECVFICKRTFSLLIILKSEMLRYIVYTCTNGYQRWPLFFPFF